MATYGGVSLAEGAQDTPQSYRRVRGWLIEQMSSGKLKPGSRIPSERALAQIVGLSRPSVTRAIARLAQERIVVTEPRNGTFVVTTAFERSKSRSEKTVAVVMPWVNDTIVHQAAEASYPSELRRAFLYDGRYVGGFMAVQIARGIFAELERDDIHVLVRSNNIPYMEAAIVDGLASDPPDGVIALPSHQGIAARHYAKIVTTGVPVVFVDHFIGGVDVDRVVADNTAGALEATRYLISLGHRRIAHFTDFADVSSVHHREAGYKAALKEADIPVDEAIIRGHESRRGEMRSYDLQLSYCLSLDDPITAVFCLNEDVLLATLQAAARMGISVPGDLEVAGFYDEQVHEAIALPFTRVVQRKAEMGMTAARLLLDRLFGNCPAEPQRITLPVDLIPRGVTEFEIQNRETCLSCT